MKQFKPSFLLFFFVIFLCTQCNNKASKPTTEQIKSGASVGAATLPKDTATVATTPSTIEVIADTTTAENTEKETVETLEKDTLKTNVKFEEKKVYKTYPLNNGEDTTVFHLTYLTVKEYDNPVVEKKMNGFIEKEVLRMASGGVPDSATFENVEKAADQFIADFVEAGKELPNDFLRVPWSYEGNVAPILDTMGILSFMFNEYSFSGGAHGNGYQEFYNFDLETGELLTLNDLLEGDYEGAVNELIERYFREMEDLADTVSLQEGGLFEDSIALNENFYLTPNELGFYYNPYEIAPYAAGPKEIIIPYTDLKKWIRKDGKLGKLVSK